VAEKTEPETYVFTKAAVLRSIRRLEQCQIHEHFAGYLAILRAIENNQGLPVRSADITEFHDRYLRVVGAQEKAPYVRPFKSRGQGLEIFNANVAGSYAPSSLRSKGKLIDVIEVTGERRGATYGLRDNHAPLALGRLLTSKVPVGALTAFLYRDYGFRLIQPEVERVVRLFREEFGLSPDDPAKQEVFRVLFVDDSADFTPLDLEVQAAGEKYDG
jgi:hypothetical protein